MKYLKIRRFLTIAIFGLSIFLYSCKPSDSKIREKASSTATAIDPGVSVEVREGVVTLSGKVRDQAAQDSLVDALKDIKGVKSVVNNTTVPAPEVVVNPDNVIRAAIESNFLQKGIRGVKIAVANGEVTLSGNISRNDLQKVMQAANEAKPKKVNNQLKIIN